MSEIRIDPKKQFSKKLARWTSVFWFLFMTWLTVLFLLVPEAALYCVYMGLIATAVMILNVWAYTRNSIYEKGVFAMLNRAKLEIGLKNGKTSNSAQEDEDNEEGSVNDGGENG